MKGKVRMKIYRKCTVSDGYFGDTAKVGLGLIGETAIFINPDNSWFRAGTHRYTNAEEMLYYFDNHRKWHFPQVISVRKG